MPFTRYQIRNEYSLADPDLYRAADNDDPEALLEGVAMAGLVGVLRQLGDLAEFAAEIFHNLHEEVMTTSARGHGLMVRVQQLEAEVPSLEKALLSQTNHASFFTNAGLDWHPNLHTERNLIVRGDLPRCVMDSYEECRAPPRLFLLDKFDVAGAGACLKRYTDPSFFKVESASSGAAVEIKRENKIRKGKKKGSRWRNGESPEVIPASHAKLRQLFLEERIENAYSDPARPVKLKRRQLNASPLDPKSGKSYMEKFLETHSPEHKIVYETSVTPPFLKLASNNSSDSGLDIIEISTVSPMEKASQEKESTSSSPNAEEPAVKSSMEESNGDVINTEIGKVPVSMANGCMNEISPAHSDVVHSDDQSSEVDCYMDALTTMESEIDTDYDYRPKNDLVCALKIRTDSDANEEQLEANSTYCQSIGISSSFDDGNNSFKRGTSSLSYSDSVSDLAESAPSDNEVATNGFPFTEYFASGTAETPSIQFSASAQTVGPSSTDVASPKNTFLDEDKFCGDAEWCIDELDSQNKNASSNSVLHLSNNSQVAPEKEINNDSWDEVIRTDCAEENGTEILANQIICSPKAVGSPTEEQLICSTFPESERHPSINLLPDGMALVKPGNLAPEVSNAVSEARGYSEDTNLQMESLPTYSFDEHKVLPHDFPQVKTYSIDTGSSYSEQKTDLDEVLEAAETEEIGVFTPKVVVVERGAFLLDQGSDLASVTTIEAIQAEDFAVSTATAVPSHGSGDINNIDCQSSNPICSPSKNLITLEQSMFGTLASHHKGSEINVVLSPEYVTESEAQKEGIKEEVAIADNEVISQESLIEYVVQNEINQVKVGPSESDSTLLVSYNHCSIEDVSNSSVAEPSKESLSVHNAAPAVSSEPSDQESGLRCLHESHLTEDVMSSSTCNVSEPGITLEQLAGQQTEPTMGDIQVEVENFSSSYLPFRQTETQDDEERHLDSSPVHCEDDSPIQPLKIELLPQLAAKELESNEYRMDPINPVVSTFVLLPGATQVSIEEMPPLPPLPPMQWRMGRGQHNPISSHREVVGQGSLPVIPPYAFEQKAQFGSSATKGGVLQHGSSSSSLVYVDKEKSCHVSEQLVANMVQSTTFSMNFPTVVNNTNSQHWGILLDRTHSLNPFLTLPATYNERPGYGAFAMEGNTVQSNDSFPSVPTIMSVTSRIDLVSSPETTQPQNQIVLGTGSEKEAFQQSTRNSEGEHDSPSYTAVPVPSPTEMQTPVEEQPLYFVEDLQLKNVEEQQPQHGLVPSEGEMVQTSNAFAQHDLSIPGVRSSNAVSLSQPAEVGKANGNPSVKIPRLQNPVIDGIAALDKSRLRKATERVLSQIAPKVDERDSLLEQIRTKSFNLKPAVVTRPSIQGPKTNLKVAAILEKANAIRQAFAGSDEGDEDSWSDS
ncbi:hypothetical protein SLEP1_g31981 [Rubroshorea leprosula]|uniref:Protein SCAR n=1 Tax=Rubroshorea leprosula TaxID=152421 RepID=A0AAV5KBV9_9ROSI|nr:hypothetical protein SLEP1_g31981 [Rubroshorea leprosula]